MSLNQPDFQSFRAAKDFDPIELLVDLGACLGCFRRHPRVANRDILWVLYEKPLGHLASNEYTSYSRGYFFTILAWAYALGLSLGDQP
jgi:hypothetical protein